MIRRHFWNDQAGLGQGCPESLEKVIPAAARRQARAVISVWSGYRRTELRSLGAIAEELGLGAVFYKDEESRFEISSFKALGGAYAVQCLLRDVFEEVTGITKLGAGLDTNWSNISVTFEMMSKSSGRWPGRRKFTLDTKRIGAS